MKCSNCGCELKPNVKFCSGCGSEIIWTNQMPQPSKCLHCGSLINAGAKFCKNCGEVIEVNNKNQCKTCGRILPNNALFCKECGTPTMNDKEPAAVLSNETKEKSNTVMYILVIILIIAIFACAATIGFLYYKNQTSNDAGSNNETEIDAIYDEEEEEESAEKEEKKIEEEETENDREAETENKPEEKTEYDSMSGNTGIIGGADSPADIAVSSDGEFEVIDKDGDVILNDNDILSCNAMNGKITETGETGWYLELELSEEGRKKFKEATKKIAKYPAGENYMAVLVNEQVITRPTVAAEIDSDTVILTGKFTEEEAKTLETIINNGIYK